VSSLVAQAEERASVWEGNVGVQDALMSAKIVGSAMTLTNGLQDGDWMDTLSGAMSTAMDTVAFVLDPIASMAGSVANFLLDYMPPLPQMLDSIAGSPPAVAAQAATWFNVADRVTSTSAGLRSSVDSALAGWIGVTADAYEAFTGFLAESIDGLSSVCQGIGSALSGASAIVELVRSIVRDVISDLVGKLISWAAQVAGTVGIGATWVVPQAIAAIALRVTKVTDWLKKLIGAIKRVCTEIQALNGILTEVVPVFKRIATRLDEIPILSVRGSTVLTAEFNPGINEITGWVNNARHQNDASAQRAEGDTDAP